MKKIYAKTIIVLSLLLCTSVLTAKGVSEASGKKVEDRGPSISYTSTAEVPFFEDEPKLNAIVLETLRNIQSGFDGIYTATTAEDMVGSPAARAFGLIINYDKVEKSDKYIGFIITADKYTGGAHGNTELVSINYDVKTKKIMSLQEALKPSSADWLNKLSEEAGKLLLKKVKSGTLISDEEWIKKGTAPAAENFKVFKIERDNVKIIFPQYQVAPYSSGMPEITIPLSFFK
ncbi:DUF3298 and DUF4163 domain-containing protein [Treponema pedis]|uniref:Endo-1,4-beta-xylanase n=1 Tax=Treponema pedis str. T A4 TaxID=1291379 RepID=S5ZKA9_9SPIR|nr:DUF3298 and DUF4163 domain-containing protein [Treponema pedis]AGT43017.1 endo-1,4-beta-xylanase [Treponema pedis str. T A4]